MQFTNPPRVEEKVKAAEGIHKIRLCKPQECTQKGWNFIRFSFEYLEESAEVPNEFCLFDLPTGYSEKEYNDFCRRVTQIRDCFGFAGTLDSVGLELWEGKIGEVEISKDKNGYLVVKRFISAK